MTFSEFAQILYEFSGGLKHKFVRDLLKVGLNADGTCTVDQEISDTEGGKDRLRKYFRGKRDISDFAIKIINSFEEELFLDNIEEFYGESDVSAICKAFESHSISIKPEELPQRLGEIYQEILTTAAQDKSAVSTINNDSTNHTISDISNADKTKINEIIMELTTTMSLLLSLGNKIELWGRNHPTTKYTACPEWHPFQDSYQKYLKLHIELQIYFAKYSKTDSQALFEDAVNHSQAREIPHMRFMWCADKSWSKADYEEIENYIQVLLKISSELDET